MKLYTRIKSLFFYWISSFLIASSMYYLLLLIMPDQYVFGGTIFKSIFYYRQFPLEYILIPCFFYGIIASLFSNKFKRQGLKNRILIIILILVLTIFISSPFGGMLWFYHDMKAGYFPANWVYKIINRGTSLGIELGWMVILMSVPYNLLGSIVCYFLTKKGAELYHNDDK